MYVCIGKLIEIYMYINVECQDCITSRSIKTKAAEHTEFGHASPITGKHNVTVRACHLIVERVSDLIPGSK